LPTPAAAARPRGNFVAVNCAALQDTLLESTLFGHKRGAFTGADADSPGAWVSADNGTLFLDEIGELSQTAQAKLLRALENGEVTPVGAAQPVKSSARVVAATNVNLGSAVQEGRFRRDLYMRLNGYALTIPPLRQRRADILPLLDHFLRERSKAEATLSRAATERVLLYDYPGNVRELRHLAARLALYAIPALDERHLPDALFAGAPRPPLVPLFLEEQKDQPLPDVRALLVEHKGNVSAVAAAVGKDRKQVYRWIEALELRPEDFRE
jgi:transcriptional regulator with PAS, ATPase and Fis domain